MSIINQMLRDLDARHASANERAGLPAGLRTLPPEPAPRPRAWFLLAAGLLVGALVAWFILSQQQTLAPAVPEPVPAMVQAQPEPSVPPAPPTLPASAPFPAPETPPAAPAPTPEAPSPLRLAASYFLRAAPAPTPEAPSPAPAPEPAPPPKSKPAPAQKPPSPAAAPVEQPANKPAQAVGSPPAPAAATAAEGQGQIEKQPKGGLSREQAEAEYRKGMQAAGIGDHATAIPALRRALASDPQHAKARQALLSVLAGSRQWDEVKQVAQSGLALDPTRTGWASILARLQYEQGDIDGALKTLENHAAYAAGDADYQSLFAFLLQKQKRHADAAQRYRMALALRPDAGRWWFGLGLALEGAGQSDEAKTAFGKAREAGNLPTDMLGVIEQKLR